MLFSIVMARFQRQYIGAMDTNPIQSLRPKPMYSAATGGGSAYDDVDAMERRRGGAAARKIG
jgi:hypothetical protein